MTHDWYFDDLLPGHSFSTPGMTVTEAQILDFARVYDPQPFHIDAEAAKVRILGSVLQAAPSSLPASPSGLSRRQVRRWRCGGLAVSPVGCQKKAATYVRRSP